MKTFGIVCLVALGFSGVAHAGTDWGKECASYGLTVGSAEYKDCVAKMTDADKATGGTMGQSGDNSAQAGKMRADADKQRAQMKTDMDKQRSQMQADMNKQMQDAKNNPKCKTTTNGTNTVTQCP